MKTSTKVFLGVLSLVAVLALVIGSVALVGGNQQGAQTQLGGGGTRFPNGISANSTSPSAGQVLGTTLTTSGTLQVGSTGKSVSGVWGGECYLFVPSTPNAPSLVASTTVVADCQATNPLSTATPTQAALTGGQAVPVWAAGDVVLAQPVASSTALGQGFVVESITGSSTAGFLTARVSNQTGASLSLATSTGIKLQFLYVR